MRALRSRRENALTEPGACESPSKAFTKAVSKSVKALVQSVRALYTADEGARACYSSVDDRLSAIGSSHPAKMVTRW
jgi:hypothetical protein